ncbi:MAG: hypothetical protein N2645_23690 [Clostridia bacterium]|nr:hypothetical protein [Clostridia bacterium]
MNRTYVERTKFVILLILIFSSLIQVGILWDYKNHGLPFPLLGGEYRGEAFKPVDVDEEKVRVFHPERVIVSNNTFFWEVKKGTRVYSKLWDKLKNDYLREVVALKPQSVINDDSTLKEWSKLVGRNSFLFEFETNIKINIIDYFLKPKNIHSDSPQGMDKILILPSIDINNRLVVYLLDNQKIYKYILAAYQDGENDYNEILAEFKRNNTSLDYIMIGSQLKEKYPGRKDVFISFNSSQYREIHDISCSTPFNIDGMMKGPEADKKEDYEFKRLEDSILGRAKSSYNHSIDKDRGIVTFKNLNHLYKIYRDGFIQYKNLSASEVRDKGDMKEAFNKAFLYLSDKKTLYGNADVFLSEIQEKGDSYIFSFDYKVDNIPVWTNAYKTEAKDVPVLNHAIEIRVNSKSVLECAWISRVFYKKDMKKYNVHFLPLLLDIEKELKLNYKSLTIRDIDIYYDMRETSLDKELKPVWIIKKFDGMYNVLPMHTYKGEE